MAVPSGKTRPSKFRDPVFVSMVVAMVMAVGSSILLRTVVRVSGAAASTNIDVSEDPTRLDALPPRPANHTHPITPATQP